MKSIAIGIDPGLSGGIAAIDAATLEVIELHDTPVILAREKRLYDVDGMASLLRHLSLGVNAHIALEQQSARPGQGVASMFSVGYGFGLWCGILGALSLPYRTLHPATWTRRVLAGIAGEGKERVIRFALQMFPGAEIIPPGCRRARDGRADALALAYYGAQERSTLAEMRVSA